MRYPLEEYRLRTNGLAGLNGPVAAQVGTGAASIGTSIAVGAAFGGPIGAAAGAIVGLVGSLLFKPDFNKIATTKVVDQLEPYLKQNLDSWQSLPTEYKTVSVQQYYLNNFDQIWQQVVNNCSNPQYGNAGQNCISDRQADSCKYHANGQCWNWFIGYRNPIANDPLVHPDPTMVDQVNNTLSNAISEVTGTGSKTGMLIGGAAILIGLFAMIKD